MTQHVHTEANAVNDIPAVSCTYPAFVHVGPIPGIPGSPGGPELVYPLVDQGSHGRNGPVHQLRGPGHPFRGQRDHRHIPTYPNVLKSTKQNRSKISVFVMKN